jgi:hypothetical protein
MRAFLAVLAATVTLSGPAAAQQAFVASGDAREAAIGGEPQPWGTASDAVFTASAHDFNFVVGTGTEGPTNTTTGTRNCAAGNCVWAAGLQIPSGAQIIGVRLSACDGDNTQQVRFWLLRSSSVPGGMPELLTPVTGTGTTATPGCTTFAAALPIPHTVRNDLNGYDMLVTAPPGASLEWIQYRVLYRLQVSPAPGTATFPNDVPTTHPFFRFVEALAAAGVTGGCSAGSYCPDAAVTRGQMAVFLATALGLHFPN